MWTIFTGIWIFPRFSPTCFARIKARENLDATYIGIIFYSVPAGSNLCILTHNYLSLILCLETAMYKICTVPETSVYKICSAPLTINSQIVYTVVCYISRMQRTKPLWRRYHPDREREGRVQKVLSPEKILCSIAISPAPTEWLARDFAPSLLQLVCFFCF